MISKRHLQVATILLFAAIAVIFLFLKLTAPTPIIGNMNGVKILLPREYKQYSVEYEGESVWDPRPFFSFEPKRTYESGIDSFDMAALWPSMEHRFLNNNLESYRSRYTLEGSKDWLSIGVQSYWENLSEEQIAENIALRQKNQLGLSKHVLYLLDKPPSQMPIGNEMKEGGFNQTLNLYTAKVEGPQAHELASGNNLLYWDGDPNTGGVSTFITCPAGKYIPSIEPLKKCEMMFEIKELHANASVDFNIKHLPEWKNIKTKTDQLIHSFFVPNNE